MSAPAPPAPAPYHVFCVNSGTIDFQEYVMGFAGMARVLTDKKAHSLIGLSTGSNIVR